ncbi:MAG: transposase [Armatimonadota bacterium]
MSGKRYTEEQIVRILGEIEGGRTVAATARAYGASKEPLTDEEFETAQAVVVPIREEQGG